MLSEHQKVHPDAYKLHLTQVTERMNNVVPLMCPSLYTGHDHPCVSAAKARQHGAATLGTTVNDRASLLPKSSIYPARPPTKADITLNDKVDKTPSFTGGVSELRHQPSVSMARRAQAEEDKVTVSL